MPASENSLFTYSFTAGSKTANESWLASPITVTTSSGKIRKAMIQWEQATSSIIEITLDGGSNWTVVNNGSTFVGFVQRSINFENGKSFNIRSQSAVAVRSFMLADSSDVALAPLDGGGQSSISLATPISGEFSQFNRLGAGSIANYTQLTASGVVSPEPSIIYGYIVTVAMSAAATTVYDNASTGSGTVLFVIPASTAVGQYLFPAGIQVNNGVYASFAGTGTVNFVYVGIP